MSRLVSFCLQRPVTTLMIHVSLLLIGALALTRLPLNSLPRAERPVVRVEVEVPDASPQQVEREVTTRLEEVLGTLSGIQGMDSRSEAGRANVNLRFEYGTDLDLVKVDVRERLARIRNDLPIDDIEQIRIRGARHSGDEIMKGRISSRGLDLSQNYELLHNRVRRPLERIDGVSQVNLEGVAPLEVRVCFRREELDRHGLRFADVVRRLQESEADVTVGEMLEHGRVLRVRLTAGLRGFDDVRAFPVDAHGLRLDQVAEVTLEEGELRFGRHLNGRFAVSIEVFKESNANTVEVCRRIKEEISALNRDPELGIELLIWEDQGKMILDSLEGLRNTGLVGTLFAIAILWLFLRRFSATLLVGMAIPISVLSALAWLYIVGGELNVITIVGLMLGVGMLVDTAVVVVESIVSRTAAGDDSMRASSRGTMEVATPIFAATLTSVIVFLPVALGPSNQMTDYLRELGIVIALTLGASLFVSLTLIPMVSARLYHAGERREGRFFPRVRAAYETVLAAALARPGITLCITAACVASTAIPFDRGFRVELDDMSQMTRNVSVFYNTDQSLDYRVMERHVNRVEEALRPHHERLGIADVYSWYKDNFAWTALYPDGDHVTEESIAKIQKEVSALLPKIPGLEIRTGDWGMFWGNRGSRNPGMRQVRVFGESADRIADIIEDLRGRFERVDGVLSTDVRRRDSIDEVTVRPRRELLTRLGMTAQDFSRELSGYFAGRRLREIRTGDGELPLRVEMDETERDEVRELTRVRLHTGAGAEVELAELGEVAFADGPGELRREERQATGTLSVQFAPDRIADANPVLESVLGAYEWPRGYGYDFGAGRWQRRQNESQMGEVLVLAIFLVFLVMACLFESLLQPLVLMATVLLALPGVVWFLYLNGDALDQPASIGLVLLAGIVVNNGIVLIDQVHRHRRQGLELRAALLAGGRDRLRPILITALTTVCGLLPMAYAGEFGQLLRGVGVSAVAATGAQAAGHYYFTLARAIVGGLTTATLLTLIVLPVLFQTVQRAVDAVRGRVGEPARTRAASAALPGGTV